VNSSLQRGLFFCLRYFAIRCPQLSVCSRYGGAFSYTVFARLLIYR